MRTYYACTAYANVEVVYLLRSTANSYHADFDDWDGDMIIRNLMPVYLSDATYEREKEQILDALFAVFHKYDSFV